MFLCKGHAMHALLNLITYGKTWRAVAAASRPFYIYVLFALYRATLNNEFFAGADKFGTLVTYYSCVSKLFAEEVR